MRTTCRKIEPVSERGLAAAIRDLADGVGERLAGTDGERDAGRRIAAAFRAAGARVRTESFPVQARVVGVQRLEVRTGGRWRRYPASLFSNAPGTGGIPVDAPLVFFEAPAAYGQPDLSFLRGKAVVHLGCHIESRAAYRRLMAAQPAFLLFVDVRYPGAVPLADGLFPAYRRSIGAVPVMNVAFQDAWEWQRRGASAARLTVSGGMRPAVSHNVVAELPGRDPRAGLLALSAHHDTQADSPGADDNASGVAGLLELARVLAPRPRRRTIRLISFGAEEQLSVGSAAYVRRHRAEVSRAFRLLFNLDAIGSGLGWTELACSGPAELARALKAGFAARGLYPAVRTGLVPYSDHFPFAAAGVPALWMGRLNCASGRFFHHRPDDDSSRISTAVMAAHLDAVAAMMADWAERERLPFPAAIPAAQRPAIRAMWRDLFEGWSGSDAQCRVGT